ncbi:MAG TPA: DMT family transporter [Candidatus Saccharimonadales bacterium]|nr:DMT family transporter [Candidatus Saccharimonadales bacterium]
MKLNSRNIGGPTALVGAAFMYAMFGVFIRIMAHMWGNVAQAAVRFALAALIVIVFLYFRRQKIIFPKNKLKNVIALGLTFPFLVLLLTFSYRRTTIANTTFLLYAGSIISAFLIGTFVLKERINTTKIIAILLALAGISLYSDSLLSVNSGIFLGLAAGLIDGVSNSLRKSLGGINRMAVLRIQYGVAGILLIILTLISNENIFIKFDFWSLVVTIIYAFLLIGLANLLLYGFHHTDVNIGTVVLSSELIFATIIGYLVYREVPSPHELIGGIFIFLASILSSGNLRALFNKRKLVASGNT